MFSMLPLSDKKRLALNIRTQEAWRSAGGVQLPLERGRPCFPESFFDGDRRVWTKKSVKADYSVFLLDEIERVVSGGRIWTVNDCLWFISKCISDFLSKWGIEVAKRYEGELGGSDPGLWKYVQEGSSNIAECNYTFRDCGFEREGCSCWKYRWEWHWAEFFCQGSVRGPELGLNIFVLL